jgi:hypothetical protein
MGFALRVILSAFADEAANSKSVVGSLRSGALGLELQPLPQRLGRSQEHHELDRAS